MISTHPKTGHLGIVFYNWPSDGRLMDQVFHMLIIQYDDITLFSLIVIPSFPSFIYSNLHNLWSCKSYLYMKVPL